MGLRGLITLDVNSDVKKCLNLQVSSTLILVTSTVMPNMHNSGLKGNFQIAISTPLVYLDKCAKKWNLSHFWGKESVKKTCSLFSSSMKKSKKLDNNWNKYFTSSSPYSSSSGYCPSFGLSHSSPLAPMSFSARLSLFSFFPSAVSCLFNQNFLTCRSPLLKQIWLDKILFQCRYILRFLETTFCARQT